MSHKLTVHDTITTAKGVKIPVAAILAAIPAAIAAEKASASDDHDPSSPGGAAVTPGEVLADIGAFFLALGEAAAPAIVAANS